MSARASSRRRGWSAPRGTVSAVATSSRSGRGAAPVRAVAPDDLRPEPVVLVVGSEDLLAERAVAAVLAAARESDPGVGVEYLDAAGYDSGRLALLASPSLFGGGTVIVVEGVGTANDAFVADASAYLAAPAQDVCLVLRHGGGQRAKGLLDQARRARRSGGGVRRGHQGRREAGLRRGGVPSCRPARLPPGDARSRRCRRQ